MRLRSLFWLFVPMIFAAVSITACEEESTPGGAGTGGEGGEGGCSEVPKPLLKLTVTAHGDALPLDTTITVTWSAAEEPPFVLGDPSTWKTLDDGVNVVCAIEKNAPAPHDLTVLECDLWTSGPTEIEVSAEGYIAHDETYSPDVSVKCEGPVQTEIAIDLARESDAGDR